MILALLPTLLAPLQQADALELTSGRPAPPEQACYDVLHYDLSVEVLPEARSIQGRVRIVLGLLEPTRALVFDLDERLKVSAVGSGPEASPRFEQRRGEVRVEFARELEKGMQFAVVIDYGGQPREAPRPPWDGGFVWSKTASGAPWIATANQMQGGDLWWPCKDQPDDEASSADIRVTVPKPLVCASNGRLEEVLDAGPKRTYHWHVSTPRTSPPSPPTWPATSPPASTARCSW